MDWIRQISVARRLAIAFSVQVALLLVTAGFGSLQMSRINANVLDLSTNWLASVEDLGAMDHASSSMRRATLRLGSAEGGQDETLAMADEARKAFAAAWKEYLPTVTTPEERGLAEQIEAQWQRYLIEHDRLQAKLAGKADPESIRREVNGASADIFKALSKAISEDIRLNSRGGAAASDEAQASYGRAKLVTWSLVAFAAALSIFVAIAMARSILQPLRDAVVAVKQVADGDLTLPLSQRHSTDELGTLQTAMQEMVANLRDIVHQVREASDSIALGANEIAAGNANLSQRTESQASSLQETTASMHQMTSTVASNSASAAEANRVAASAASTAESGGSAVSHVITTIGDIASSSRKIGEIISVIDAIAFQTNILALNAAVESARAGDHGRGFAVVAGEVRALAQRSATAAREIKGLIEDSTAKVEAGVGQAGQAGEVMASVLQQVRSVSGLIGDIATASSEQATGVRQVGQAVSHLDEMTQQNAALVEESAAAAESLKQQADLLAQVVRQFRLAGR
ncbi:methyl-accepting chemotaxis protein [Roseateles sp.]|uniref:methyl-accepting chemotaxis protein n=1 Tax=Roseateles sp. TaxID=1971397 RepID=UPI0025EDCA84|nr:methyl-accepting chemotaxis protein [Roseateles sp.]MBV8034739.1 MCP four helix bundle domain-containing protein [Roseateles sp.]